MRQGKTVSDLLYHLLSRYLQRTGLVLGIAPVVDSIEAVPDAQRAFYVERDGQFHFDPEKLSADDIAGPGLKSALDKERSESKKQRDAREALEQRYKGIDPDKVRDLLARVDGDEEAALIAAGKLDDVIAKRTEKLREAEARKVHEAEEKAKQADQRAAKFSQRVLDNAIRIAATGKVHDSALKSGDVMRAAREVFQLSEDGEAVQIDAAGNVMLGKDGKTPFSPGEWIESMRESCPHWFPATGSGGGASGDRGAKGGKDLSHLSPTERLTAARAQRH